jgi:membrane protease YdiL (CAAX protease family)
MGYAPGVQTQEVSRNLMTNGLLNGEKSEMSDEMRTRPPDANRTSPTTGGSTVSRVFLGERGIRAGWSVLLFVAIFQGLDTGVIAALSHFVSLKPQGPIPPTLALIREFCEVLVVLAATWVMARIEKRRLFSFGYTGGDKMIRLVSGAIWGFVSLSVLIGVLWKSGSLVFDGRLSSGLIAWKYAFAWALVFLLVGIFEESLLRGYLQFTLSRGIGFRWAALLLSVTFALLHVGNSGESPLGLLCVGAGGFVFCLSLWYTKSLWWAVGFHAGWDWGQSYFYGTPNSGLVMKGHLLAEHPRGNPLWSGGAAGPEASLFLLPLLILMAICMWIWWGRRNTIVW